MPYMAHIYNTSIIVNQPFQLKKAKKKKHFGTYYQIAH